jgi:hypothetical protein
LLSARPTLRPTRPLAQPAPDGLSSPTGRSSQAGPSRSAHVSMAYLQKYIFPFDSRLLSWPPPSRLPVKWARAVSSVFLPRRPTIDTFSHRLRPPRAARPPTSRCPVRFGLVGLSKWILLGCGSVTVRLYDAIE